MGVAGNRDSSKPFLMRREFPEYGDGSFRHWTRDTFAPRHSETRRAQETFARRHSESASTRAISAEGSPSSRHIRTAPQRERFDTHDLRRGFAELKTIRTAPQRECFDARSPQRVRRAQDKFARLPRVGISHISQCFYHAKLTSQRTLIKLRVLGDFAFNLRKGFTFVLQCSQMSETLRLPHNSQTLFMNMLRLPRIL